MSEPLITAVEMARHAGIDPKAYRRALRSEGLRWHGHNDRWTVPQDSPEHDDMRRVLTKMLETS